jgi:uncharacterized membrane protein YfcA
LRRRVKIFTAPAADVILSRALFSPGLPLLSRAHRGTAQRSCGRRQFHLLPRASSQRHGAHRGQRHQHRRAFSRHGRQLLLAATVLFLAGPRISAWVRQRAAAGKTSRPLNIAGFFLELLIAIYIGYFGAGVGILVLSLLALLGMEDIHAMNGVKVLLVSVVNGVAMITFIFAKMIFWPQAVLMILGSLTGGYAGAHYAQKMNQQHVRWIVIAVGLSMSIYFFVRY